MPAWALLDPAILLNLIITGPSISFVPLTAAFLFRQRYWQSGLTLGCITGSGFG